MDPAALSVDLSSDADRVVISASGDLDMTSAYALEEALQEAMPEPPHSGPAKVVVDLREVSFIDSTGVATLVRARHRAQLRDASLLLVARSIGPVSTVLRITGLLNAFEVFESPEAVGRRSA